MSEELNRENSMGERSPDPTFTPMRRRDRAIEDRLWIHDLLTREPLGTLATIGEKGPSLNPNLFAFDVETGVIFLHTARKGGTRDHIERHPRVAFSVAQMGRLLPAESAIEFSVEFASVILEGRAEIVTDGEEASRALGLLMSKYAPHLEMGKDYRGISDRDLARTTVIRVVVESWSGKGKTSDAVDAYGYEPPGSCLAGLEALAGGCPLSKGEA